MLKWKVLAFLGLVFGVAGVVWGYAQQKNAIGFFELRVYTAQPGKRDALAARFADRTAASSFLARTGSFSAASRELLISQRMASAWPRSGRTSTGTWYVAPPTRRERTSTAGRTLVSAS